MEDAVLTPKGSECTRSSPRKVASTRSISVCLLTAMLAGWQEQGEGSFNPCLLEKRSTTGSTAILNEVIRGRGGENDQEGCIFMLVCLFITKGYFASSNTNQCAHRGQVKSNGRDMTRPKSSFVRQCFFSRSNQTGGCVR